MQNNRSRILDLADQVSRAHALRCFVCAGAMWRSARSHDDPVSKRLLPRKFVARATAVQQTLGTEYGQDSTSCSSGLLARSPIRTICRMSHMELALAPGCRPSFKHVLPHAPRRIKYTPEAACIHLNVCVDCSRLKALPPW